MSSKDADRESSESKRDAAPSEESISTPAHEPSAREVNRQMSAELSAEKQTQQKRQRGTGAAIGVLRQVQVKHPGNPKKQIAQFMRLFDLRSSIGRNRAVSEATKTTYGNGLIRIINDLRKLNIRVQNIGELSKRHAQHLIKFWLDSGFSERTVQGKISILRRFLTLIGKGNAIPRGNALKEWMKEYGVEIPVWAQTVATESKAWDENGINPHEVIEKMTALCEITASQLEMQWAFGLRMKESLMINPSRSDLGDALRVLHGTKGGLGRDIPFDESPEIAAWQRDVLNRAKAVAAQNSKGILAIPGKSLKQSMSHFYYCTNKLGISQSKLGITAHGLRHQYAARRYEELSGMPVPVSGKAGRIQITPEVRDLDKAARQEVSLALGHFRDSVTKAYIGSLKVRDRATTKRIEDWVDATERNLTFQKVAGEYGIGKVWLAGKFADGQEVASHEKLRLIIRTADNQPISAWRREQLTNELARIYCRGIDLSQHFAPNGDSDWYEIFLHKLA